MSQNDRRSDFNIFIANSIYPEAEAIFTTHLKPLVEIKDDSVVILDTNALLVPYTIGKKSLDQIETTYKALVNEQRLIIPGQVAREFAKNRANKIGELFQQLNRKRDNARNLQIGRYPLLDSLPEYKEVIRLESEIDRLLREYKEAMSTVLNLIRGWTWNDPVSVLYSQLFDEKTVVDLSLDEKTIQDDLGNRQRHNIPPGYKDSGKEDRGVGDLLIWHTILEIGKNQEKNVIFVSGDEKADWYHKSEGQALYPRYELVDEFRRYSKGRSFHIISFSSFLDLFGASKSVVQEVRQEEMLGIRRTPVLLPGMEARLAEEAVYRWLIQENPEKEILRKKRISLLDLGRIIFDFVLVDSVDQTKTAVDVKVASRRRHSNPNIMLEIILTAHYAIDEKLIDNFVLVVVASDKDMALDWARSAEKIARKFQSIAFLFGVIDSEGEFVVVIDL